jgi:hypothetical protein
MNNESLVLGVFSSSTDAEYAIHDLFHAGYKKQNIFVVMRNNAKAFAELTGVPVFRTLDMLGEYVAPEELRRYEEKIVKGDSILAVYTTHNSVALMIFQDNDAQQVHSFIATKERSYSPMK